MYAKRNCPRINCTKIILQYTLWYIPKISSITTTSRQSPVQEVRADLEELHSKIRCVSSAHLVRSPAHKGVWWWHTPTLFHFKVQTNTQKCVNKHRRCVMTTYPVIILQLTLNWWDANVLKIEKSSRSTQHTLNGNTSSLFQGIFVTRHS